VDELPWTTSELLGAEVLVTSALGGGEAAEPATAVARGAVAAVPLVVDGALDAVLSIHWPGEASAWSPSLAPLVRVLVGVLRGAEQLAELAERPALDEATGLANRKLLLVALGRSLAQLERRATSGVAVVVCQISAPPEATSQALVRQVGRRLDRQTRDGDLVAVFDGHTVVVVCDGVPGPDEALAIARRLSGSSGGADSADSGAGGADGPGEPVPAAVRVSFGVAHADQRVAPGVLLRQADAAAYLAATSGELVRLAEG
jgi:GGDEF domain-containing protein